MINFETLPTGSKLRIQFSDGFVAHATYSHLAWDYVYGHFDDLPTEECTILEICGHDKYVCLQYCTDNVDYDNEEVSIQIIEITQEQPQVYVQFKFELIGPILEKGIEIFYDYMWRGFQPLDPGESRNSFSDDGFGMTQLWNDEELCIRKEDHDMLVNVSR